MVVGALVAPEILVRVQVLLDEVEGALLRCLLSHASTIDAMSEPERSLALVLSGGGMNGLLLGSASSSGSGRIRCGSESGWIYGTSAGALSGVMASLDRLDALEEFVLALPPRTFRPNRLWQMPLSGLHDSHCRTRSRSELAPMDVLARQVAAAPIELVVTVTDVTEGTRRASRVRARVLEPLNGAGRDGARGARLGGDQCARPAAPGRRRDRHGRRLGRNLPLGHAYDNPRVAEIVGVPLRLAGAAHRGR